MLLGIRNRPGTVTKRTWQNVNIEAKQIKYALHVRTPLCRSNQPPKHNSIYLFIHSFILTFIHICTNLYAIGYIVFRYIALKNTNYKVKSSNQKFWLASNRSLIRNRISLHEWNFGDAFLQYTSFKLQIGSNFLLTIQNYQHFKIPSTRKDVFFS